MDECLEPGCKLTLVSAPPGFGKTTLISSWISSIKSSARKPKPFIAWLSLDIGENDPVNFWTYLITALQSVQEGIGKQALSLLQVTSSPDLDAVLTSLVNDLVQLSAPILLILDDYHLVRDPEIHNSISTLIDHGPNEFHILILSRTDPPLPLALLRSRGQLLEIRLTDLRFTNEEATVYLNHGMRLSLPESDVDTLNAKTEGWIAGLQMAGLSMQGRKDTSQFIQSFNGSNRYILDYLTDEILDRQEAEFRNFLLHISVLERFNASLCTAVVDAPKNVQLWLEKLDKANLFLIPLDQERQWFRYHHLFADLLRAKLAQSDPNMTPVLQKRAAEWFEENGMLDEAVFYTHAAKDDAGLIRLIEQSMHPMMKEGRIMTAIRWVQLLPENLIFNRPWLSLLFAWWLVSMAEFEKGSRYLDRAEDLTKQGKPGRESNEILGIIYSLRTQILEINGDVPAAIETANKALKLLDPNNIVARSPVDYILGRIYYESGDMIHAEQVWSEFIHMAARAKVKSIYAIVMSIRSVLLGIQGKLREAIKNYQQAIDTMLANDITGYFGSGNPYLGLGMLSLQINDLVGAENLIDEGMKLNRIWGNLNLITVGLSYKARLQIVKGDLDSARVFLQEEDSIIQGYKPYFEVFSYYFAYHVQIFLAKGDLTGAARMMQENGISSNDPLTFRNEQDHITLARVIIAQGNVKEAESLLHRLEEGAKTGERFGRLIEILILRAVTLQALGRHSEALQSLKISLALAEPEGSVRIFIDEGEPMAKLLETAIRNEIHPEYASRLLASFPASSRRSSSILEFQKLNLKLVEPLSGREIMVLQLIAEGLTNKEIAQRLSISVRTVKYHNTRIFTKLEVDKRDQAILKAMEIGLLKP
jgi:LuxR family maltose regulon positive regulatory protein